MVATVMSERFPAKQVWAQDVAASVDDAAAKILENVGLSECGFSRMTIIFRDYLLASVTSSRN